MKISGNYYQGSRAYYGGGLGIGGIIPIPIIYGGGYQQRYPVYCEDSYRSFGYGFRVNGGGWGYGPCYY